MADLLDSIVAYTASAADFFNTIGQSATPTFATGMEEVASIADAGGHGTRFAVETTGHAFGCTAHVRTVPNFSCLASGCNPHIAKKMPTPRARNFEAEIGAEMLHGPSGRTQRMTIADPGLDYVVRPACGVTCGGSTVSPMLSRGAQST
jgi:hypothetical protein